MPKAITQEDVRLIAEMIRNWPKSQPFKWRTICQGAKSVLGYEPTRQALHKKPSLVAAYETKRTERRTAVATLRKVARPQSMLNAIERIAALQEENDALKAELEKMAEVARRFIHNASAAGLSREKLMAPLPEKAKGNAAGKRLRSMHASG